MYESWKWYETEFQLRNQNPDRLKFCQKSGIHYLHLLQLSDHHKLTNVRAVAQRKSHFLAYSGPGSISWTENRRDSGS